MAHLAWRSYRPTIRHGGTRYRDHHTGTLFASIFICLSLTTRVAMAIEEPSYETLDQQGDYSVRRYAPVIIAETTVAGTLDHASSVGFRRLADYIFGGNRVDGGAASAKIAMTAPVGTQREKGGWTVNFTMPRQYALAALPRPNDAGVQLLEVPGRTLAVLRFSGWVDESKVEAQTALLRAWASAHSLDVVGEPQLARYDPPWTLPFFRRNEILLPVTVAKKLP